MKNAILALLLLTAQAVRAEVTVVEGKVAAAPTVAVTNTLSNSTATLRVEINALSASSAATTATTAALSASTAALDAAKYAKAGGAITGGLSLTDSVGGPSGAGYNETTPAPAGNMVSNSSGTVVRASGFAGFNWMIGSQLLGHGYGNAGSNYTGVCHGGTEASPTLCPSGSDIMFLAGKPYDGTNATTAVGSNVAIRLRASEAASPTGRGTHITLSNTKIGTTSRRTRISLLDTGNMVLAPRSDSFSPSGAKLDVTGVDAGIGEAGNGVSIKAYESVEAVTFNATDSSGYQVDGTEVISSARGLSAVGAVLDPGGLIIGNTATPSGLLFMTQSEINQTRIDLEHPSAPENDKRWSLGAGDDGIFSIQRRDDTGDGVLGTPFSTDPAGDITLTAVNTVLVNANLFQTQDVLMSEGGAGTNLVMHSDDAEVNNKNWELSARPTGTWSLTRQDDAFGGISTPLLADATGNLMVTDSNSRFFSDGSLSIREFAADDATPEANLDVNGDARFGSGGVTTIGSDGEIAIAENSALTLSGATGDITTASSVTASAFFGNGSALVGVLDNTKVLKAGDTMTGTLTMSGAGATIVSGSSITASGFFGASLAIGANIVYYCTGSTAGTFDGNLARGNGNAGACAGGTWVATSLKVD